MPSSVAAPVGWRIVGTTVRGASHEAVNLPNQDAIAWDATDARSGTLVLAVSDGHGSPKCFRSDVGSHLAVQVAIDVLGRVARAANGAVPPFGDDVQADLARTLSDTWNRRVDEHLRADPFTGNERERLEADERGAFDEVARDPLLAYGATLVSVLVTPAFALYVQIGDGDILAVDEPNATRRVFAKDPALAINETYSLCQHDAWKEFRLELIPFTESLPDLIIATTDGYVNSFATDPDFLQVGRDLRAMIRGDGLDALAAHLPAILGDTSRAGSRDDVTMGVIKRVEENDRAAAVLPRYESPRPSPAELQSCPRADVMRTPQPRTPPLREPQPVPPRMAFTRRDGFADAAPSRRRRRRRRSTAALALRAAIILGVVAVAAAAFFFVVVRPRWTADAIATGDKLVYVGAAPSQLNRALGQYDAALKLDSRSVAAWRRKAYVLALLGRWPHAADAAGRAVALDGPDTDPAEYARDLATLSLSAAKATVEVDPTQQFGASVAGRLDGVAPVPPLGMNSRSAHVLRTAPVPRVEPTRPLRGEAPSTVPVGTTPHGTPP